VAPEAAEADVLAEASASQVAALDFLAVTQVGAVTQAVEAIAAGILAAVVTRAGAAVILEAVGTGAASP